MSVAYTLVDTEEGVRLALPAISSSPYLILDCEGEELGMQGGALSLIQIGTAGGEAAFLFDAARLQRKAGMRALLRLLACPDIRKIVWDGRQDAVALHEKYGVVLAGVLDLQLAEIISRANARGEDDLRRRNRLVCVVGRSHALYKPEKYRHVHALMGLDTCLKDCEVGMEHVKDGELSCFMHDCNLGP
jgi:exonuclease 3'-5' domain-containing protein 1